MNASLAFSSVKGGCETMKCFVARGANPNEWFARIDNISELCRRTRRTCSNSANVIEKDEKFIAVLNQKHLINFQAEPEV